MLIPGVQLQAVSGSPLQPEKELLLIGAKAVLNHRVVIGRTVVNVEVLQSHLLTLSMEALLELQTVVCLHVTHGNGQRLDGMVQGKEGPCSVHFGEDESHLVVAVPLVEGLTAHQ